MSKKEKNKKKIQIAAVIDIGTNALRLKIAQSSKGAVHVLEELRYPLSLGRDTFNDGKITFEKLNKACEVLKNFITVTDEYDVDQIITIATTAIREAHNREYIIDQIQIKTGLEIEVLDDISEKNLIYMEMTRNILKLNKELSPCMMVYIGSGNLGIAYYENGNIPFMQNLNIGSLRITELFDDIQEYTANYSDLVEEYQESVTDMLHILMPENEIKYFVACGREIVIIADICDAKKEGDFIHIPKEIFHKHYNIIKEKTPNQIREQYNLPEDKAELLFSSMSIYNNLLTFTYADEIIIPLVFLRDALLYQTLFPEDSIKISKIFEKNTILCAYNIAKRYHCDIDHSQRTTFFALKIFDKMKKIHGMGKKERLYLETAGILHDIGKFINLKRHHEHSYNIINGCDIVGLSLNETNIVANIAKYHSKLTPSLNHKNYKNLSRKDRVKVSKLSSIMRIGDSLDRSHENKFDNIEVKIEDEYLIITIETNKNIQIEEWAFKKKGKFFEEVFGIKAVIRKKKVL